MEMCVSDAIQDIVIIGTMNDNKNNTYNIIPKYAALGSINKKNEFIDISSKQKYSSMEDILNDDKDKEFFCFPTTIDNLKKLYPTIDDTDLLIYEYMKDISSKLHILLKGDKDSHLFSCSYDVISKDIVGNHMKTYRKSDEIPAIQLVSEENNQPSIDILGLEKYLKERIIGNDGLIEDIVTTFVSNYLAKNPDDVEPILSIGPSGSGKTATYKAISEYLDIPMTIYDCNLLSSVGYVGKDLDDALKEVYLNSNRDLKRAEKSILMFDEVDKLAIRGADVKDAGVQQQFLKLLDGFDYTVETRKNSSVIRIDSSYMTIGFCGAFIGILDKKKKNIGFNTKETIDEASIITANDLIEYGMLPEFVNRIKNVFTYKVLTKDDLKQILLYSKNSPLLRKIARCDEEFNALIEYTEEFIDAIVDEAYSSPSGARSLSNIVSRIFKKIDHYLLVEQNISNTGVKRLTLTQEIVENNRKFNI